MGALAEQHPPVVGSQGSDSLVVHVWMIPEGEHWTALVEEFNIAGLGGSSEEAMDNAVELLSDYLALSRRDGLAPEQARRDLSLRMKLKLHAKLISSRLASLAQVKRPQPSRLVEAVPRHC